MAKPIQTITPISGPNFPTWTKRSDYYIPTADLTIENGATVNTSAGNDTIRPTGPLTLTNFGSLILGTGNDNVNYADNIDNNGNIYGMLGYIYNYGLVDAGRGDDIFRAYTIFNYATAVVKLGDGNDFMNSALFYNYGNVEAGAGNDIVGFGTYYIDAGAFISLGSGSDQFGSGSGTDTGINYGTVIAGLDSEADVDQIRGLQYSNSQGVAAYLDGDGIDNHGTFRFGGGNDICSGQGTRFGYGIKNIGSIYMESGDDLLSDIYAEPDIAIQYDSLTNYQGVFNGSGGIIDMGTGNDTIKVYTVSGSGSWVGGDGTDTISLGKDGIYVVEEVTGGFSINGEGMFNSFEQIRGWNTTSNLNLLAGTYTISNSSGTIDFAA